MIQFLKGLLEKFTLFGIVGMLVSVALLERYGPLLLLVVLLGAAYLTWPASLKVIIALAQIFGLSLALLVAFAVIGYVGYRFGLVSVPDDSYFQEADDAR